MLTVNREKEEIVAESGEKFDISDLVDEFVSVKEETSNGDIRREIEEAFTCWIETYLGEDISREGDDHEFITELALQSI
jgi:hypothetical protein